LPTTKEEDLDAARIMKHLAQFCLASVLLGLARAVLAIDTTVASAISINPALKFTRYAAPDQRTRYYSKRAPTFTSKGRQDYCGETDPWFAYGTDAPLAADCKALATYWDGTGAGFYTLAPGDFDPATGWAKVVSHGSCAFAVKFQLPGDKTTALIGTNDIRFYTNTYVGNARDGRLQATGTIGCYNGQKIIDLLWGLIRS
jgi:hypothetical protein